MIKSVPSIGYSSPLFHHIWHIPVSESGPSLGYSTIPLPEQPSRVSKKSVFHYPSKEQLLLRQRTTGVHSCISSCEAVARICKSFLGCYWMNYCQRVSWNFKIFVVNLPDLPVFIHHIYAFKVWITSAPQIYLHIIDAYCICFALQEDWSNWGHDKARGLIKPLLWYQPIFNSL